ncbi:hypothetical protein AAFF_G00044480 [Aldrovandia affinis]|uniref:Homeobox domain-containing protein n=1 Tax=Aldrovandia affinis TaxID=143900 RepID=A0AAD7S268_9TELE|nr:hypothetical protein AAFF_G00044480 [Aldrovandia affinis]
MASRRKSTTPCMIRASDMVEQDDPDEMEVSTNSVVENGSSQELASEDCASAKNSGSAGKETTVQEKPEVDTRPQRKPQGGYECKYCPFSTQNLNEFKEHVDSNHPNVILNPLYLCAVCNFNTKKFDSLTEHNEKCHPGESNFKFKRIKLNSQTILEQSIEGANSTVIYDVTAPQGGEDCATFPLGRSTATKTGKPKTDGKRIFRKGDEVEGPLDGLMPELPKKPITALNINRTVIIPEAALKEGLSHIMPSLQRPPNFNLVPKIAVPLNTSKYNPLLDGNVTLITSFNKFPYPTQAELSWLTAASKHPEEQIKVWFTTQRLKQGISWSPEEVEEARKKMFNGTIQSVQQTFTVLPAHLTQQAKASHPLIHTLPCHLLGQTSLVLTPVANGSPVTCAPIALTIANQVVQALKRPLAAPVVAPEVKRPTIIQTIQTPPKSASPTPSFCLDRKKTRDQITVLKASYIQNQFPEDKELYHLIEATGLSRGEIKKWFSDQRYRDQKGVLLVNSEFSSKDVLQKSVPTQFPLLERVKGKTTEQLKMLEESFQKTSFPTQAEVDHLVTNTRLSKKEIDSWFSERRALRDNLEQALMNSMGSKKVDEEDQQQQQQRGFLNGVHEQEGLSRASPLPIVAPSACPVPINSKSLELLKDVFAQTQWPSPEEYNQLEGQTGLVRTEIVRWFKDNRAALKSGTLEWMEQFQKQSNNGRNGQSSLTSAERAQSVLQQYFREVKTLSGEDVEKLSERSKLSSQEITDWFASKLIQNASEANKGDDQLAQAREGHGSCVKESQGMASKNTGLEQELVSNADGVMGEISGRVMG